MKGYEGIQTVFLSPTHRHFVRIHLCPSPHLNMNYPDLDQPIAEQASILDQPTDESAVREHIADEENAQRGEMVHFLQPARWWLASSAFPLLAVRRIGPSIISDWM